MAGEVTESIDSLLRASDADETLGVHDITEFLFCQRAGVISWHEEHDDPNASPRTVLLGYLPKYDLASINEAIGRIVTQMFVAAFGGLIGVAATLALAYWGSLLLAVMASALLLITLAGLIVFQFVCLAILWRRRIQALGATPGEPQFAGDREVAVDWWKMRAAGWTPHRYPEGLHVDEWKLSAKPWLVLFRGNQRIPVFRWKTKSRVPKKQHFARIAGYCALIERATGCESPYGILLYHGKQVGVAIPFSEIAGQAFAHGVRGLRHRLQAFGAGLETPKPRHEGRCWGCPHGDPIAFLTEGRVEDGADRTRPLAFDRRERHSPCGDRFNWTPKHRNASRYGLIDEGDLNAGV